MKILNRLLLGLFLVLSIVADATTTKITYPATNVSLTVTGLNSLVNSATTFWASDFVDNTTNQDIDALVTVQVTGGASGVSSTGTVLIYVYGCVAGTTTCTDGANNGTQGTFTATNPTNLVQVRSCNLVVNGGVCKIGPFSVANAFGGVLAGRWGVAIQNQTGATLAATGNAVLYDRVQMTNQ